MPGKLRRLSGSEVLAIFRQFGFEVVDQRGSHVKLRRIATGGRRETLVVPLHNELDRGTLHAIFRQASRFVPSEELYPFFHTE